MTVLKGLDDDSMCLNFNNLQIWESFLNTPYIDKNTTAIEVSPVDAINYTGDMYGLFHNVYDIPNSAIYINIRINGFTSSSDYNGARKLKLLSAEKVYAIVDEITST